MYVVVGINLFFFRENRLEEKMRCFYSLAKLIVHKFFEGEKKKYSGPGTTRKSEPPKLFVELTTVLINNHI